MRNQIKVQPYRRVRVFGFIPVERKITITISLDRIELAGTVLIGHAFHMIPDTVSNNYYLTWSCQRETLNFL